MSFWILLGSHIIFVLINTNPVGYNSLSDEAKEGFFEVEWQCIGTATSLSVFFLVFYGGQCCIPHWRSIPRLADGP